jgi:hypothetical protein
MFLNSLDKKPLFKKEDGNTVRDLTQTMFDFRSNNYTSLNAFKVSRDYVMRPDLISQAVYNNILYAEYILKYNGISNPFSIQEGDVILIPNLESAKLNTKTTQGSSADDVSKRLRDSYKYIDPTKIPKKDGNTTLFDDRNLGKKTNIKEGALPPNIADEGVSQIVERNGRVYFGEGIGESACLKNGMSSSEFLTQVIKSRRV